jgi:hypothetical protein
MRNDELESLLKSVPAPERSNEYWETFPGRVQTKIDQRPNRAAGASIRTWSFEDSPYSLLSRLRIGAVAGLAFTCLALLLTSIFWHTSKPMATPEQIAAAGKYFREIEALFPHQLQAIAFDRSGAHMILSDQPDVPVSPPLYLRICADNQCRSFVTFSGQEIRFNGETCQVLVDRQGGVMVVGEQWVWSSSNAGDAAGPYRIAASPLPTT